MPRPRLIAAFALGSALVAFRIAPPFEVPKWAYPTTTPGTPSSVRATDSMLTLPGSSRSFSGKQIQDLLNPPDWHPEAHPSAPDVVMHGRREVKYGCGLCHLPDGQGRSENATLAGLPEAYMLQQLADMRSGARAPAMEFGPSTRMKDIAIAATDSELAVAARYFAGLRAHKQYSVVETKTIPMTYEAGGLYARKPGADSEPLGARLMEVSDDIEHHEMRDPGETFTVYVQPGTLKRGKALALAVNVKSPTRCATCHGMDLRGLAAAPPIAGKSPLYMLRQLSAFRMKTRNGSASGPMQLVTEKLTLDQMIAATAYAGSLKP